MSQADDTRLVAGQHAHFKAGNTRPASRGVELRRAATSIGRARTLSAWWCERFHQDYWSCLESANGLWQCQRCSRTWMLA